MAEKLQFSLVSPERLVLSEDVDMVTLPGTEGDFGVLQAHAPMMSTLKSGILSVQNDGSESRYYVLGGFAEVNPEGLTVLAEHAGELDDAQRADFDRHVAAAEHKVETAPDDEARQNAEQAREHLQALIGEMFGG